MASVADAEGRRRGILSGGSGEFADFVARWLASPWVWCGGGLLLFAALMRWRMLQRLRGALLLAIPCLALLSLAVSQERVRAALLVPSRFEVLLFLGVNILALWLALHGRLASDGEEMEPPAAATGVSVGELWLATAVGVVVLGTALLGVPPASVVEGGFFQGELQLDSFLVPWVADLLLPVLSLFTLLALPWLHRPVEEEPAVDPVPRNAGLALVGLGWLWMVVIPMVAAAFQDLPSGTARITPPVRTLGQRVWHQILETEMPASWFLRESPGILFLTLYFGLLPFLLLRLKASRGFCRRSLKALGVWRYSVILALVLVFSLVPLKMVSCWWLGIGAWISIPELSIHF